MWPAYNFQPIQDAITNIVATKTWVENGGTGTISEHDRMLVINQTREVHMAIEQFLDTLRTRRRAAPTLSVELHWLWLDPKQRGCLLAARVKPSQGQKTPCVDPQRLQQVAREARGFHGRVSCVNGLGTVLAAGDRRLLITGAIPVVGGPGGDNVGYTPMTSLPNVGVTARIRPTFVPGTKTANLDIVSLITRWDPARKPALIGASWTADKRAIANNSAPLPAAVPAVKSNAAVGGSASCPVDRPVVPTQQISTTLRVPLGKPVIVGSMTFDPAGGAGLGEAQEGAIEVYLIATTSIVREAKR
jgi:hypothetical protein